ncbi:acylphosphatase [Actinobacillus equuli]|uniref:Uncharacterized protein n=1 Tax=Actinobacillus equuli TaxID=718 RepID=A0AAX3FLA0_ACTEU|nr:hypothetical protein [Actinobacillus equuli]AIZ78733.1 hypothetical protein ACEE_02855 [Actinobacillus equuli subsp. equuli]WGE44991.1 acylphosphatase [Actinobacillus equuli subsp. equuli]VEE92948.1 Uncharacterised protein [Actinobacillus equuli]
MKIAKTKPPEEWSGEYLLECLHSLNSKSQIEYLMYCNFIKNMPDGRVKIKVFGSRFSMVGSRIRYVDKTRIHESSILDKFNLEWRKQ